LLFTLKKNTKRGTFCGENSHSLVIKASDTHSYLEPVSSGSIMSDYGLDDPGSIPGAKDFSSILCVQTDSGVHPASSPMGTGGPFPGGKGWPGRDADHSPPSSAEVGNE
jgi:hypothetical protein